MYGLQVGVGVGIGVGGMKRVGVAMGELNNEGDDFIPISASIRANIEAININIMYNRRSILTSYDLFQYITK